MFSKQAYKVNYNKGEQQSSHFRISNIKYTQFLVQKEDGGLISEEEPFFRGSFKRPGFNTLNAYL